MEREALDKLRLEMRRGSIVLAVLAQLRDEHYAYSLRKSLLERDISIDEGTLYPLVRRLEKQGLLTSEWREEEKRNKRFYRLSDHGRTVFEQLRKDWEELNHSVGTLVQEN
jgi:PadR family transcriptional regulator PadR